MKQHKQFTHKKKPNSSNKHNVKNYDGESRLPLNRPYPEALVTDCLSLFTGKLNWNK